MISSQYDDIHKSRTAAGVLVKTKE